MPMVVSKGGDIKIEDNVEDEHFGMSPNPHHDHDLSYDKSLSPDRLNRQSR
jgi:hypothetical protein